MTYSNPYASTSSPTNFIAFSGMGMRKGGRPSLFPGSGDGSTLSLDFTTGVLDPRLTFSRASTATFVNSSGYVDHAGANTAPYSESLITTGGYSDNAILSRSTTTSPTGNTAVVFYPTLVLDYHRLQFGAPVAMVGATTVSVYVKQIGSDYRVGINATGYIAASVICSLIGAGSVVGAVGGTASNRAATITKVTDDGWYRITLTGTYTALSSIYVYMTTSTSTDTTGQNFVGVASQGIAIWGLQVNPGSTVQTYYPTTGTLYYAPRFDYSPTNIGEPRGLLVEGQTANVCPQSQALTTGWQNVAMNTPTVPSSPTITDPFGGTSATWKLVASSSGTSVPHTWRHATLTFTAASYTFSFWAKAAEYDRIMLCDPGSGLGGCLFVLTGNGTATVVANVVTPTNPQITPYPNGWYRCSVTMVTAAANYAFGISGYPSSGATTGAFGPNYISTGTSGVYATAMQIELGTSGASSYIPTGASQVTRTADSCLMSGTNFSSWFNNTEGTCLFVGDNSFVPAASNFATNWALISAANSMRINNYTRHTSGRLGASARDPVGTALTFDSPTGSSTNITTTDVYKTAFALKTNDFAYCVNGNTVGLGDASNGVFETVTSIEFARDGIRNGHTKQFKFYPTRLTNAQLQALTAP